MAVNTSSNFFDLLQQSELLSEEQLAAARELAGDSDDPKEIALRLIKEGLLTKWQGSMLVKGRSNMHLGKYRLLEQLSSSDVGHMFHAEHTQMGRQVAVRTLSRLQTKDPQAIKRFLADARQIAALDHRNLIHVYDVDSDNDRYYLVSEFVDGEDLQKRVERTGPLAAEQAARYIRHAALGLAHAHEQGIVHGDVKPSNLLIDSHDTVRVLDVGVARISQSNGKMAADETTAKFRAPEQASGDYDHRADIYALGRTLYFALTGQVALSKDSGADVGLLRICQKMIAKDPENRYQTAAEVADTLAAWSEKKPAVETNVAHGANGAHGTNGAGKKPPVKASNPKVAVALPDDTPLGATDGNGLAVDTNSPPPIKSKSKPPLPTEGAAAPKRAGLPPWAFLAGAGGLVALLLLVGGAVGVYMMFFNSPSEVSVAANDPAADAAAVDPSDPEYDPEAADPEKNDPELNDPELANPESSVPQATGAGNDEDPDVNTANSSGDPDADNKAADPTSVFGSNDGNTESAPPTEPATPDKPVDKPPAGTNPDQATNNTTPPKAEPPKAAPPKAEPPKPAPPASPFRNLTQHVSLPPLDTSDTPAAGAFDPQPLGDLFVKPSGELLFMELHGGATAFTGAREFSLAPNVLTERDWDVMLSRGASETLKIATISAKDNKLWFQWLPAAKEDSASANIANCVLFMRTNLATHWIALRTPIEAAPMEIEFTKGSGRVDYQLEAAPDPTKVMVEIAAVEGFPEHSFDPEQAVPASDETTSIRIGQPPSQVLSLKVDTKMRKGIRSSVQISALPQFKLEGMPRDERFVEKEFQGMAAQVDGTLQQVNAFVQLKTQQLQQAKKSKKPKQEQDFISQQILQTQNQIPVWEARKAQLQEVTKQLAAIQPTGKIHFRIYIVAGEYQVDLVRSDSMPKPQPAKRAGAKSQPPKAPAK